MGNGIPANIDLFFMSFHIFYSFRIKRGDLIIGNMSNNEETGPSDQDADEMDYEGEQEYLDYLTAKQGLQVGLDDGTDADIDTDGAGTDGGAENNGGAETGGEGTGGEDTGGEGTGADAATEKK